MIVDYVHRSLERHCRVVCVMFARHIRGSRICLIETGQAQPYAIRYSIEKFRHTSSSYVSMLHCSH